jgi:magnesium transporter
MRKGITYVDDKNNTLGYLLVARIPPLLIGLVLGVVLSYVTSRFEQVLSKNIKVAYFIPFIVYIADAVGTQTENIYVRNLRSGKAKFKDYVIKESLLGAIMGAISGGMIFVFVDLLAGGFMLGLAVSLATMATITLAPLVALTVVEILELEHTDPAVGAGPIATVIQDTISVVIYGLVASWIIL